MTIEADRMPRSTETLPPGWAVTSLGDICVPALKVLPSTQPDRSFRYIDISSIDNHQHAIISPQNLFGRDAPSRARQSVREGDVLFSTVRTYLENIALVPRELDGSVASTGFCVLRPADGIDPRFIFYGVLRPEFLNRLAPQQRGTSYPAVRDGDVKAMPFPLAPTAEQRRIVAVIEEQFSRIDAGVEALERARRNLRRMMAAIVQEAIAGRLVTQDPHDKPAEDLLKRVLGQRRAGWSVRGHRGHYREPIAQDRNPRDLPPGWAWTTIDQLAIQIDYGTSARCSPEPKHGVPVLRMGNIQDGELDLSDLKYLPNTHPDVARLLLSDGDVLFNRTNSPELVGKTAVFRNFSGRATFASYLIRVRLSPLVNPRWVSLFINGPTGRSYIAAVRIQQVGQANVNGTKLAAMPIALPPGSEQQRIVEEVDRLFSAIKVVELAGSQAERRAERLRREVLAFAFSGRLVPQNPSDESAKFLLDRIKADGVADGSEARRSRKRSRR